MTNLKLLPYAIAKSVRALRSDFESRLSSYENLRNRCEKSDNDKCKKQVKELEAEL